MNETVFFWGMAIGMVGKALYIAAVANGNKIIDLMFRVGRKLHEWENSE